MSDNLSLIKQEKWVGKLSEEEFEIFNLSFNIYEKYKNINGFCILLEKVMKCTEYKDKKSIKKILVREFIEDIDYKILQEIQNFNNQNKKQNKNIKTECSGNQPSTLLESKYDHNKEYIYLTKQCFTELCGIVNTDKGKKFRKLHSRIINFFNEKY